MRETLDPWIFVAASYAVGLGAMLALVGWALITMTRAERRRDDTRKR